MSKHTWLTKPSKRKADLLLHAFRFAVWKGEHPINARTFAGYWTEIIIQRGSREETQVRYIYDGVKRSDFRFARGKYSDQYNQLFDMHVRFWVEPIAAELGLSPETPAEIVADRLEELGDGRSTEVRSWVSR